MKWILESVQRVPSNDAPPTAQVLGPPTPASTEGLRREAADTEQALKEPQAE
jgi:hypothetical protein